MPRISPASGPTWDYQAPYPGGPMVKVKGFPRPLYPPSAVEQGKKPSSDGPDVIAYKRTISRAGRWPWQTFDDSYTEAFALGDGDVATSGVAGVQRQQHVDATGWIGEATFNTLRSIIVPNGLPNSGEPAMDKISADLIDQAWHLFGGNEPAGPQPTESVKSASLKRAMSQLGVTEGPRGSNRQKYGAWYGMNGVPWCAIFCTWNFVLGANDIKKPPLEAFARASRYAYVPYVVADARAGRNGLSTTDDPEPGDLVCYDWRGDSVYDHIGIFERWVEGPNFIAIEGNTSVGNDSNGGEVMRRERNRRNQGTVFVRVRES